MYRIKLDNENYYHERCIIIKILKLDENTQYGFPMTKPMPIGCIKEHPAPSWPKFNLLLETVDLDDWTNRLDIYLSSISSLMRKEQLNERTCITRFYL